MEAAAEGARRARVGRVGLVALGTGGVVAAALLGVWAERRPIAAGVIDRRLAAAGVRARYRIEALGTGRQRLADVVIGDPAYPDLVADWVELGTHLGLDGARVTAVRAGRVRLRAALVGGRLSLGSIDRLLPAPSGKPFALPAIDLSLEDGRARLATPAGVVGVVLAGTGRLDGGFAGRLAVAADRLVEGGCTARDVRAAWHVRVERERGGVPVVDGPLAAAALACGETQVARPRLVLTARVVPAPLSVAASARLASGAVSDPRAHAAGLAGELGVTGGPARWAFTARLGASGVRAGGETARAAGLEGMGVLADRRWSAKGRVTLAGASAPGLAASLSRQRDVAAGTPVAPLAQAGVTAAVAAVRGFDATADVDAASANGLHVGRATMVAASGAHAVMAGGAGLSVGGEGLRFDGRVSAGGGGLPGVTVSARQTRGRLTGVATLSPWTAGGARLATTPVRFAAGPDGWRITGTPTLSGPIGARGRVEGLTVPLAVAGRAGRWRLDQPCVPVAFARLTLVSLRLDPARLSVCPRVGSDGVAASVGAIRLAGRLGASPLTLAAADAAWRGGFVLHGVEARLGQAGRESRLSVATLGGAIAPGGVAGDFAGAAGQIAAVPLLLSDAAGGWRFAGGALALTGGLTVSDPAPAPRFHPLPARDVALSLTGNGIAATGTLVSPDRGRTVATVAIAHDLASGTGHADLALPGLVFDKTLQPDALTPLTFGVVADVAGTMTGAAHIGWSEAGVTSTGSFRTDGTDLAAAFGPVQGIAGTLRFTDLLNLESAPATFTLASVNPGVPVTDGRVDFRLLPGARVQVARGAWPFAGGQLVLEPTLLDFGAAAAERRLTFTVTGVDARRFLAQFDFKNLDATGIFDGTLPMIFDAFGGRIEGGRLAVRANGDGAGGGIAYVGDLSQKDLGFWGNLAFQSLKSLRYRRLSIDMDGPLAGEMVTQVRFAGVSQGRGAKSNFLVRRLQRLPLVFNVTIRAPFRGLVDSARSFYDPRLLIERNLPALLKAQPDAVQPPASGAVR